MLNDQRILQKFFLTIKIGPIVLIIFVQFPYFIPQSRDGFCATSRTRLRNGSFYATQKSLSRWVCFPAPHLRLLEESHPRGNAEREKRSQFETKVPSAELNCLQNAARTRD